MSDTIYNKIIEHIADEISDVADYKSLAAECDGYARAVICQIVSDEESHARYLASVLDEAGREMPHDLWDRYQVMERTFRQASER